MKYPIARPYITDEDKRAVMEVLDSGMLSLGPKGGQFEQAFARHIGTRYACAVSSGTAGLHVVMIAAGISAGDEVITSPFSFVASANCILYVGATPVFVDIDPDTYNMDPANIEAAITPRTKAIIVVHIFGQSADMDAIMAIAKKYQLIVIEDACESIDAAYQGQKTGTFGVMSVFAFYPNKQMTTGEGGMICMNDERLFSLCKGLTNQGRSGTMKWLDHQFLGYNYRLDDMSAALGMSQLERLTWMIAERQKIAGWYQEALMPHADIIQAPQTVPGNTHTWFVYVVLLKEKAGERNEVIERMEQLGIATKPYLPSIHFFSFYRDQFGFTDGMFPISERVSDTSLALPFYIGLTKTDVFHIVKSLVSCV